MKWVLWVSVAICVCYQAVRIVDHAIYEYKLHNPDWRRAPATWEFDYAWINRNRLGVDISITEPERSPGMLIDMESLCADTTLVLRNWQDYMAREDNTKTVGLTYFGQYVDENGESVRRKYFTTFWDADDVKQMDFASFDESEVFQLSTKLHWLKELDQP